MKSSFEFTTNSYVKSYVEKSTNFKLKFETSAPRPKRPWSPTPETPWSLAERHIATRHRHLALRQVSCVSTVNCESIGPLVCPPLATDVSQTGATHFSKVDRAKSSSIQNVSVLRKVARRQISKFRRDQGPMANRSLFDENELGEADDRGNDSPLGPEGETLARLDRQ